VCVCVCVRASHCGCAAVRAAPSELWHRLHIPSCCMQKYTCVWLLLYHGILAMDCTMAKVKKGENADETWKQPPTTAKSKWDKSSHPTFPTFGTEATPSRGAHRYLLARSTHTPLVSTDHTETVTAWQYQICATPGISFESCLTINLLSVKAFSPACCVYYALPSYLKLYVVVNLINQHVHLLT
jgi:hypothetical protein